MEEEKDATLEPDEDVEAHSELSDVLGDVVNREDEGDDVEAHKVKHDQLAREDDGDDVEGHMAAGDTLGDNLA